MPRLLYIIAGSLLLFNGVGAIYGGASLVAHPDGSGLGMGLEFLEHTPFNNYLIPGIVLLVVNGGFSMFCFGLLLFKYRHSSRYIIAQGILLTGWIMVQMLLIQTVNMLHIVMATVGLLLTTCGVIMTVQYETNK